MCTFFERYKTIFKSIRFYYEWNFVVFSSIHGVHREVFIRDENFICFVECCRIEFCCGYLSSGVGGVLVRGLIYGKFSGIRCSRTFESSNETYAKSMSRWVWCGCKICWSKQRWKFTKCPGIRMLYSVYIWTFRHDRRGWYHSLESSFTSTFTKSSRFCWESS